jgi:hypothetical protein
LSKKRQRRSQQFILKGRFRGVLDVLVPSARENLNHVKLPNLLIYTLMQFTFPYAFICPLSMDMLGKEVCK